MEMMEETHPSYDLWQLQFQSRDTGHAGSARDRTYVLASHQDRTSCLFDPDELKGLISKRMQKKVETRPSDYFMASRLEVDLHAQAVARRRGIPYKPDEFDLKYLLTDPEQKRLKTYEQLYLKQFGSPAAEDENLVVFLSDNPEHWKTWSASSGSIPTMRRNSKHDFLWAPALKRWMVPREKLAAMAWPVNESMSAPMCCQPIPLRDVLRASDFCGNAMNFTSVGVAQMLALSCFSKLD